MPNGVNDSEVTQQTLADFGATISAKPNLTPQEIFQKFPEFKNNANTLQSALDYETTLKSGKYKDVNQLNSKFPEFNLSVEKKSPIVTTSQNGTTNTANGTQTSTQSEQPLSSTQNNSFGLHPVSHVAVTPLALGRTPSPVAYVNSSLVPKPNSIDKNNVDMSGVIVPDKSAVDQGQKIEDAKQLKGTGDAKTFLSDKLKHRNAPLSPTQQNDGSPTSPDPTDLNNYTLESIKKNIDLSNPTEQLAYDKYQKQRNLNEALKTSPNLDEAAISYESSQNPLMQSYIKKGIELPDAYKGQAVADFLSQPNVIEKAKNDPEFKQEYNQTAAGLYSNYPKYATRIVGQKISQEREDLGDNNALANIPTQDGTDAMVNKMVKDGKLTPQEQLIYEKNIRPQLGVGKSIERGFGHILPIAQVFTDNSPIETPDVATRFGESYQNTMHGMANSVSDLTGISNNAQRTTNKLNDDYSAISVNPVGAWHTLSANSGDLGGMIAPMILGGEAFKAIGVPEKASGILTNTLVFAGTNKDAALTKYPDSPAKQLGYTLATTGLDATLAELLPTKEVGSSAKNLLKDDIGKVVSDFTDDKITADAAKKTVLDKVQNFITKTLPKGAADIAEKSTHTGLTMGAFKFLHNGLDRVFGGADTKNDDLMNGVGQAVMSGFIGSLPLSAFAGLGNAKAKITGDQIQRMANDPQKATDLINQSALISPELAATKDERLANLNEAVKVNAELNQTDLTDAQKQKFLLNHLAQKALESKADNTTTDVIKKDLLSKAKEHQNTKEAIYSGKDKAPEFEQPQPIISSPINTIDNGKETNDNAQTEGQEVENKGAESQQKQSAPSIEKNNVISQDKNNNDEIVSNRLSPAEKQGGIEAGRNFVQAANVIDGLQKTSTDTKTGGKELRQQIEPQTKEAPYIEDKNTKQQIEKPSEEGLKVESKSQNDNANIGKTDQSIGKEESGTENKEAGTESETGGKEPNKVGISHNSLTELAKKIGLKEPERGTRLTNEEQADRGRQLLNAGVDVEKLEKDFKGGKQPTADDISVARAHLEDLYKIADAMKEKWGKDSKQYDDANKEIERFSNEVMKPMGSKTSEPFSALRGERDIDTGSFTSVRKAIEDNKGSKVTKSEENKIDELTTEHSDNRNKAKEAEAKLIVETDKDINEGQKSKNKETKKKSPEDYAKQRKASFDKAREALKKIRSGESGLGVGIPLARELAAIAPHVKDIIKTYIDEGVDKFGDIVDKLHEEFSKSIQGLRKRDIMDVIAGDYNKKSDKTLTPDEEKIKDIKQQAILTKKLQDLQNDLPEDFDKNKKEQSPEVKQLLEQIAKVRKDLDDYKGVPEKRRIAALEKRLEDLRNGTEKEPTPELEKSEKEKQLLEQIAQEKINQGLKKLQKQFDGKKDNKFTPDEAKAIWDYARKQYLDKGVPFNEMIKKVALDTGLTFKQVSEAITSPKIKPISDEMWAKQAAVRRSNMKVKDYIESHNKDNPISKFFKAVSKVPKSVTTAFHGHIFAGTHYPMGFVTPSQWGIYFDGIGKAWKNAYGSEAFHEKEVQDLTSDPNYILAKRAGLQNDVDNTNIDEFEKGGKILGGLGRTGAKGFLGMKWTRQAIFNDYWNNLPEEQKTNESAKVVASLVNLATGASNLKIPDALQEGMFAAGMESARWGRIFQSPAKAIEKSTGILSDIIRGREVKPEDKVFLKVWGSRVGQQLGTITAFLAANAFIQSKLNPKNPTNLTDPTKPDWLKFKADNTDIDLSGGILGIKNFLITIATYAINDKNHKQELGDIGGKSVQYLRGKLSPLYGDIADVGLGTDYSGNPLPFSNKTPSAGTHKLSWSEYLLQKSPIFIAEAVKNIYDNAEQNGIPKSHTDKIVNGIMQSVITTGTGVRTTDSYQKPTPYTDDDYKDPVFKYFSKDWEMELPNTAASSETIKDDEAGTKKKLSDYPQDIQDKYTETHKQNLHDVLSDIKDQGSIFIKTYKDAQGNPITEVSLTEPSSGDYDSKDLSKLSEDEKKQVLRLAQDKATSKTKKDIFDNQ